MNDEIAHLTNVTLAYQAPEHVGAMVTIGGLVEGFLVEVMAVALNEWRRVGCGRRVRERPDGPGSGLVAGRAAALQVVMVLLVVLLHGELLLLLLRIVARDADQVELRRQRLNVVGGIRLGHG